MDLRSQNQTNNHLNNNIDAITASIDALDPISNQILNQPQPPFQQPKQLPIRLIIQSNEQHELNFGLKEISLNSVRNNLSFISIPPTSEELDQLTKSINRSRIQGDLLRPKNPPARPPESNSVTDEILHHRSIELAIEFWWFIKFELDTSLSSNMFAIDTSHNNFYEFSNTSPTILSKMISNSSLDEKFSIKIRYRRKSEAFKALGHLLAITRKVLPDSNESSFKELIDRINGHQEICNFESLGFMIDCSRNGVLKLNRVKELLRFSTLMGLNMIQLYTEDTYQIANEPFFGYFRGPYTQEELKAIDDYAFSLGIEVVPCIQTLGHLGQMLQWPRYGGMRDTHEVLLAGSEEVYEFIERMIRSITTPLRSKRIHIGMDEAHGVSEGRYKQLFGHKDSTQVFTDHLRRVNEICSGLELKPMIWSDMLFCLAAKNNSLGGYYDSNKPELLQSIPPEIELVYWDYYHTTSEPYVKKIEQHRELNFKSPTMASGIWTWSRFWTALPFTIETIRASMKAIKKPDLKIDSAMTTIWGDEGNECDIWSALPGLLYFAEQAYSLNEEVDVEILELKFDGIMGGCFDDFMFASKLDDLQPEHQLNDDKARFTPNLSKWLIWEEPFYSILSPQYAGHDLETHYNNLATYLNRARCHENLIERPLNARLELPGLLANVLSLKCHLRDRLAQAYGEKDIEELIALAGRGPESRMSRLIKLVDLLWRYHRDLWMSMYKPFGWEVLDLRYGGLRARLDTMHVRLGKFLDSPDSERIEELEVPTEVIYPSSGAVMMLDYHRVSRPQYC
ncbi:hypothetical protein CROQUDRAFT_49089 [Cronartium quercuum f. sp. fusiforme G11]|uniref:beta-N-acetylhexosaminidase n=1 Tax=Cronartium quercuum f. sp. fusiforme G11 TaxID=708437 RepID=A0A9P6NFI5_9BASI|nr:hypothetical protein CROQUDRAFT_49089 [Cronartium quercuum f. sp. fusiforme G11]